MTDLRSNRYDLTDERSAELMRKCLDRVDDVKSGLGVIELSGSEDASDIARGIERAEFDRAVGHRVPHTPDFMTHEYGPYEDQSTFFLVLDVDKQLPLGTVRLIKGLANKTTIDLARDGLLDVETLSSEGFTDENTWDITSLAVSPVTRAAMARSAILVLFRVLYIASIAENVKHWTAIIEDDVIKGCHGLGMPFRPIEEVGHLRYMGTDCAMYVAEVDRIRPSMTSHAETSNPRVSRRIYAMLDGADFLPEPKPRTIIIPEPSTTESENPSLSS